MSIVGAGYNSIGDPLPFYWANANEKPTTLIIPDGYISGTASGINNSRQIVGIISNDTNEYPAIWTTPNAIPTKLPLLDGYVSGGANGINNLGQIVGYNYRLTEISGFPDISTSIPVVWENYNDKPTPLPLFDEHVFGFANGINDSGKIVGFSNIDGPAFDPFPFIWTTSTAMPIQLLFIDGYTNGRANGINNSGQIVGYNNNITDVIQTYWADYNETPIILQSLDGNINGAANGINNLGQIVGYNIIDNDNYFFVPLIWGDINTTPTPLQLPEGYTSGNAYGISDIPEPTPIPISNICFPAGTPVRTDQGIINIDQIDPQIHTIASKNILCITRTTTLDTYLISFEKNSLGRNVPYQKTVMTKDHKIMFKGRLVQAYRLLSFFDKVKKVKYTGETLYNVLLKDHGTINVNNLVCETLHPDNIIAKLYMRHENITSLVIELNSSLQNKDVVSYKNVVHRLTHNL
jgi:uncharacterized membrane protein